MGKKRIPTYMKVSSSSNSKGRNKLGPKIPVTISKLSRNSQGSYDIPEYWRDEDSTCKSCGCTFTLSAANKQFIFEELKLNIFSSIDRCLDCQCDFRKLKARIKQYYHRKLDGLAQDELLLMHNDYQDWIRAGGRPSNAFARALASRLGLQ